MTRPRKPIAPARRARLMDVARQHFARHGFAGTSLVAVLTEASFPRSSFYYFFDDKASLFDAAFRDGLARIGGVVCLPEPEQLTGSSFWPTLQALLRQLDRASGDAGLLATARLFHLPDAPDTAGLEAFQAAAWDWCRRLVSSGRRLGVLDDDLPEDLHTELAWNVALMTDRWLSESGRQDACRADVAWALLQRVLGGDYRLVREDASK